MFAQQIPVVFNFPKVLAFLFGQLKLRRSWLLPGENMQRGWLSQPWVVSRCVPETGECNRCHE
jgi:hypothetical protein